MKNEVKKLFEEEAKCEPAIKAYQLLEEIIPLLKDYFIGQIDFDGDNIFYALPNEQTFKISAECIA